MPNAEQVNSEASSKGIYDLFASPTLTVILNTYQKNGTIHIQTHFSFSDGLNGFL